MQAEKKGRKGGREEGRKEGRKKFNIPPGIDVLDQGTISGALLGWGIQAKRLESRHIPCTEGDSSGKLISATTAPVCCPGLPPLRSG